MSLKRAFDLLFCAACLPVVLPIMAGAALLVKLGSAGPVFYRGTRVGLGGHPFRIFKFRTMVVDAERRGGTSTARNDPRLVPGGEFLRKYKLDELPQIINVMLGDMSVVGPRPQIESLTAHYTDEDRQVLSILPGMTDYASIRFINLGDILGDEDPDGTYMRVVEPEKNRLRLKYVRERSLWVDVKIIALTCARMLRIPWLWNERS
jgi:lipopolysaccharide/colanic/teichoic acid biosynthesis glycosyltransferase